MDGLGLEDVDALGDGGIGDGGIIVGVVAMVDGLAVNVAALVLVSRAGGDDGRGEAELGVGLDRVDGHVDGAVENVRMGR